MAPLKMRDFVLWQGAEAEEPERTLTVREDSEAERNAAKGQKSHF